jgi:hypothetical protein
MNRVVEEVPDAGKQKTTQSLKGGVRYRFAGSRQIGEELKGGLNVLSEG